ncbi:hypothetical protein FSP39_002792 [Pinctada imbricata]|uniref:Uncharacterized protein n=1 Tax=Pinctada imbricata TaxID=66713 RepID=A0AA88YTF0_PINIB|nr:hypothetical protein FSP39_002792 [Pinctada imbricata]
MELGEIMDSYFTGVNQRVPLMDHRFLFSGIFEVIGMTNMDNDHIPVYSTKSITQKIRNRRHTKSG